MFSPVECGTAFVLYLRCTLHHDYSLCSSLVACPPGAWNLSNCDYRRPLYRWFSCAVHNIQLGKNYRRNAYRQTPGLMSMFNVVRPATFSAIDYYAISVINDDSNGESIWTRPKTTNNGTGTGRGFRHSTAAMPIPLRPPPRSHSLAMMAVGQ